MRTLPTLPTFLFLYFHMLLNGSKTSYRLLIMAIALFCWTLNGIPYANIFLMSHVQVQWYYYKWKVGNLPEVPVCVPHQALSWSVNKTYKTYIYNDFPIKRLASLSGADCTKVTWKFYPVNDDKLYFLDPELFPSSDAGYLNKPAKSSTSNAITAYYV